MQATPSPRLLLGVPLLLLSACATLSKSDFLDADWERIGEADGDRGRTPDYIERHTEACAKHGVAPDAAAWTIGYTGGLDDYCTVRGGLEAGSHGASYQRICKPGSEEDFLQGYRLGRRIHQARIDIAGIEQKIRHYEIELSRTTGTNRSNNENYRRRITIELILQRQRLTSAESDMGQLQRKARELLQNTEPALIDNTGSFRGS